jgi:transketolase
MLEGVAEVLRSTLEKDPRAVLLYADALPKELQEVAAASGERAINVGIAEATLVSLAGGLAATGMRPVVVALASFLTGRAHAQLRQDIALDSAPVTFVGFGAGAALAAMGPTHCTLDDLGLMGLLPGMDLAAAADRRSAARLLLEMLARERPGYLRIEGSAQCLDDAPIEGGVQRLREGADATVVVHGAATHDVLAVADAARQDGIEVSVLGVLNLRPLDPTPFRQVFGTGPVMVVENHVRAGGLGSLLLEFLPESCSHGFAHLTPNAYSGHAAYSPGDFRVSAECIHDTLIELITYTGPVRT